MNQIMLTNLNRIFSDMARLNESISSQRQMATLSDNPPNLVSALGLRSSLAEIKQYSANLVYGGSFIDASESALQSIKEGLVRARVIAINAINGGLSIENKNNMAQEVHNIFEETVTLANTQINGKYIFAGYRTAGYNEAEPAPFIADQAEGYRITGKSPVAMDTSLTGTVDGSGVAAGDLTINGIAIGAIAASSGATDGLFMDKADAAVNAINAAGTGVTASLTTLYAGNAASSDTTGLDTVFSFAVNDIPVSFTIAPSDLPDVIASKAVAAINEVSGQTGVAAAVGIGGASGNGGPDNSVVLQNMLAGDASTISITGFSSTGGNAGIGFSADFSQAADAAHNTGQISLASSQDIVLASPNNPTDDSILQALGLGGGKIGFADDPADGMLQFGTGLGADDLEINGVPVGATAADGFSSAFVDASAEAKAAAINAVSEQTGVSAVVVPVYHLAAVGVKAGTMNSGDLIINGIDIFDTPTAVVDGDSDNTVLDAINAKSEQTGIAATRDGDGKILLTTMPAPNPANVGRGRNLQIQTSANGESITHLNGGSPPAPQNKVYFGTVQLRSERTFMLETTPTTRGYEPGLAALGLNGGSLRTGLTDDKAGDGRLSVNSIQALEGNVRYAGDSDNDIAVKVGKSNTLNVSKNGQDAIMNTGVFSSLSNLEFYLQRLHFTSFHSVEQATDTTVPLNSGATGLARADEITAGKFAVKVTDYAVYPPDDFEMSIAVDPANDSLQDIATKINGVPGISASWDSNGNLQIQVDDAERYSVTMNDTSTNFLEIVGLRQEDMQSQELQSSLAAIDDAIEQLNNQVADFGARANRITVQNQIYDNLELATADYLSKMQDTDLVEAMMQLTSRQTAYQAALTAAAQTMQLSLVNFL